MKALGSRWADRLASTRPHENSSDGGDAKASMNINRPGSFRRAKILGETSEKEKLLCLLLTCLLFFFRWGPLCNFPRSPFAPHTAIARARKAQFPNERGCFSPSAFGTLFHYSWEDLRGGGRTNVYGAAPKSQPTRHILFLRRAYNFSFFLCFLC